jgi:D-xylulose reductase
MEPLSVGIHSVSNLGGFRANQSIAVFGCGPVGLLCMAVAKALGASRIIAVDIVPARLEFAKQYAATETYLPVKPVDGEGKVDYSRRNAETMRKELGIEERGNKAIDLVIDASGAEVSIQTGLYIAKAGGTFVQVLSACIVVVLKLIHGNRLEWETPMSHLTLRLSPRRSWFTKAHSAMECVYVIHVLFNSF